MTTTSESAERHSPSGTARLLPGAPVAEAVLAETAAAAARLRDRGITPSLATIAAERASQ
ncbi:hypothetical protein [Micromonospora sp. NBC_00617]|uniref:hypothetical protein n=1 Tax=Micromonospora sp. NBC_00617 TaxID=2903587 RepID=UPI0030DF1E39